MIHLPDCDLKNDGFKEKKKSANFIFRLFSQKKNFFKKSCVKIESTLLSKMDRTDSSSGVGVARVPSALSVRDVLVVTRPTTPARLRDIDTDMEALRISRQDNPFLQQMLASRESLADSLEESESDDINLMSQEFCGELGADPLSLPEMHQHMIRSPPPTSWPRSPNFRMFRFPTDSDQDCNLSIESAQHRSLSHRSVTTMHKSTEYLHEDVARGSASCAVSPRLSLTLRPHQRSSSGDTKDRFSLLTPAPLRSLSEVRRLHSRSCEESQQLVSTDSTLKH